MTAARLVLRRRIVNAGSLELGETADREASILYAGRDHYRPRADSLPAVERGAEVAVVETLEKDTRLGTTKRVPNFIAWTSPRQTRSAPEIPVGNPM
jgi:hypothetical protein